MSFTSNSTLCSYFLPTRKHLETALGLIYVFTWVSLELQNIYFNQTSPPLFEQVFRWRWWYKVAATWTLGGINCSKHDISKCFSRLRSELRRENEMFSQSNGWQHNNSRSSPLLICDLQKGTTLLCAGKSMGAVMKNYSYMFYACCLLLWIILKLYKTPEGGGRKLNPINFNFFVTHRAFGSDV